MLTSLSSKPASGRLREQRRATGEGVIILVKTIGKQWKLWIGIIISVVALVLALRGIDLERMVEDLAQARYVYLVPAGASLLLYLVARSIRWRLLLGSEVSLLRCFWVTNVGYLVSNVLPFRLGDPARAVAIGLDGKVKVSTALSTVVVERVLDMLLVVVLLAITLPFVEQSGWLLGAGVVAGAAAVVASTALILLALRPDWVRRLARWCLDRLLRLNSERWMSTLEGLLDGLSALRSARRLAGLLLWSVVSWVFVVGYYWGMLWAFVEHPPLAAGSFLTCAIGLGMALPAAPGAVGVFESFARYALELPFGMPEERATAVAFVSHAYQYVLASLLGLIGLAQLGLSLARLRTDAAALGKEDWEQIGEET
jgi:uncharacterized protein (TIRG00374 family)